MAHQTGAYPGFCRIRRPGIFLLAPEWNASPSQSYPQRCRYPFIHLGGERHCGSQLSKNTTQCPRPRFEPRTARSGVELTNLFRPPGLPLFHCSAIPLCKNSKLHSVRRLYVSVLAHCFRSLFSVAVQSIFFLLLLLPFLLDPRRTLPPELHRSLKQRPRSKIPKERTN